jgi:hypothetical protein
MTRLAKTMKRERDVALEGIADATPGSEKATAPNETIFESA